VLFADMELIGIPHRLVLSERGLAAGGAEYKGRRDEKPRDLPLADVVAFLKAQLAG
jgi:prolyl-tRNA synthetase